MTFGEKIRKIRKEKGLTLTELGEQIGMSASGLARYETGRRGISVDKLKALCDVLNISRSEALEDEISAYEKQIYADKLYLQKGIPANFMVSKDNEYLISELEAAFNRLNESGQQKAVERVEELAEISKYQKDIRKK